MSLRRAIPPHVSSVRRSHPRAPLRALIVAAIAFATGCGDGSSTAPRPRSVLIVTIDTLRADRLGFTGHAGAMTPTLDGLAARGTAFLDVTASTPVTLPSHASIFTGQDPSRHGVRDNAIFALSPAATTIAERARAGGLRTGAAVASIVLARRHGLDQGFEAYDDLGGRPAAGAFLVAERPATEVNRALLQWLDAIGDEPFLAWAHYMEPHAPYAPSPDLHARFPHDPYQAEIATADRALGQLLGELESRGSLADTLVIVTSDHGEGLGEHGEATHGVLLHQATLHVPLVMAGPGVPAGRRITEPVASLSLAATMAEALALEPLPDVDGPSLWSALAADGAPDADADIQAETLVPFFQYGWSDLRCARSGPWKYVHGPHPALYRLDEDPRETRNLLESAPERASVLQGRIGGLLARTAEGLEPEHVQPTAAEMEALHSLGYVLPARRRASPSRHDPAERIGYLRRLDDAGERMRAGNFRGAEDELNALVTEEPTLHQAQMMLFTCRLLAGDFDGAEAKAREILRQVEDDPFAQVLAARTQVLLGEMYERTGRVEQAIESYEHALAIPQPTQVLLALARLQRQAGRADAAQRTLQLVSQRGELPPG